MVTKLLNMQNNIVHISIKFNAYIDTLNNRKKYIHLALATFDILINGNYYTCKLRRNTRHLVHLKRH